MSGSAANSELAVEVTSRDPAEATDVPAPPAALPEAPGGADDLGDHLSHRVEKLFDKFDQMEFVHAEAGEATRHMAELVEALTLRIAQVESAMEHPAPEQGTAVLEKLGAIMARLEQMPERNEVSAADGLADRLVAAEDALRDVRASIDGLDAKLDGIGEVLASLPDLAGGGEAEAILGAIGAIRETLGGAAEALSPDDVEAAVTRALDGARQDGEPVTAADLQAITGALEILPTLGDRIEALGARADSAVVLEGQQRGFAEFSELIETVARRVEQAVETIEGATAPRDTADEEEGDQERTALLDALGSLPMLVEKVELLRARPDPVLDMAPQRRSFAQFASVLGAVVARLEASAEVFAQANAPVSPASDGLEKRLDALEGGLRDVAAAVERLGVPKDPVPTLVAQNRSFARFQSAAAGILRRMDGVSDRLEIRLAEIGADPAGGASAPFGDGPDWAAALASLAEANRLLAAGQECPEELRTLHRSFLADLRMVVAEFMAEQMRDRAGA